MPCKLTNILTAVPSDNELAQTGTPVPIQQIAAKAGILPDELELYGAIKAKAHLSIRDRLCPVAKDGSRRIAPGMATPAAEAGKSPRWIPTS